MARHLAEQHTIAKDSILNPFARFASFNESPQARLEENLAKNRHTQELEGNFALDCQKVSPQLSHRFFLLLADAIGLRLTSRACFDPQAAVSYVLQSPSQGVVLMILNKDKRTTSFARGFSSTKSWYESHIGSYHQRRTYSGVAFSFHTFRVCFS